MKSLIAILALFALSSAQTHKISPPTLLQNPTSDILITFGDIPSSIYNDARKAQTSGSASRTDIITQLVSSLQRHASSVGREEVEGLLIKNQKPFQRLWITNQLGVKGVSGQLIAQIAEFSQVTEIVEDVHLTLEEPNLTVATPRRDENSPNEWGIQRVKAPQALEVLAESQQGSDEVRVAIIDTGVMPEHESLSHAYLGEYGWFDPSGSVTPIDSSGHGTHVAGTIVGRFGIGVFPSAKFLMCRGCPGSCPSSDLIACGQFTLCPHLPDGSNQNCSLAPHVVSNSWNGGAGQTWFDGVINAWHAGGVIPVFSAGNKGPACSTFESPADSRAGVISVGATTNMDSIAYFSGTGPSAFGEIKPDITAPGYDILSAWITSTTSYMAASGTSMAAPHASGLVALLVAYKRDLTYEQAKDILQSASEQDGLYTLERNCGGVTGDVFPNNDYGHGRLDALRALELLIETYPQTTEAPPTEEPTTEPVTEEPVTDEPITEEPVTDEPTTPGDCPHGPIWVPDHINVPNLVCICQVVERCGSCDNYEYKCFNAVTPPK